MVRRGGLSIPGPLFLRRLLAGFLAGTLPKHRSRILSSRGARNWPTGVLRWVFLAGVGPILAGSLGQGIENWSVGGSSPEIWEVFEQQRRHPKMTIIGVSVYDLNEMRLAPDRASYVSLSQTISDLWASGAEPALSHRILTQYALSYVRLLFPTAGDADRVLVGVRRKVAEQLGLQASLEEHEGILFQPSGVLDAGESTTKVSDWSVAKILRRIEALRVENRGRHEFFKGPKSMAFHRMLFRARRQGRVIVVVLPVSRAYAKAFLDENVLAAFERALDEAMEIVPEATLVRLDRVPGISDHSNFFDLVHMNSSGRRMATPAFLMEMSKRVPMQSLGSSSTASIAPGN
jgi:hypothetical protein